MDSLIPALRAALANSWPEFAGAALSALPDTGLAHWHVRVEGAGWIARIPKQSQMRLDASANLSYQAACFARASAGGSAPKLMGVLSPSPELPRGALLVEEIDGPVAQLPTDLPAIARALARIHRLPAPAPADRPPLLDAEDPLQDLLAELEEQGAYLDAAGIDVEARQAIDIALGRFRALLARPSRPEKRLISFDAHPGNFLMRADGSAVLVDLEKGRYAYPPLDLAHATLYTSTTWDVATHSVLSTSEVVQFCQNWAVEFGAGAEHWAPWIAPLRRAMWLWSVTWCAKWRVSSAAQAKSSADGEDWSADRSEAALIEHVRGRVDEYLSAECVVRVSDEIDALESALR